MSLSNTLVAQVAGSSRPPMLTASSARVLIRVDLHTGPQHYILYGPHADSHSRLSQHVPTNYLQSQLLSDIALKLCKVPTYVCRVLIRVDLFIGPVSIYARLILTTISTVQLLNPYCINCYPVLRILQNLNRFVLFNYR